MGRQRQLRWAPLRLTETTWLATVNNRVNFWNYPGSKNPSGTPSNARNSGGWSVLRAISIAKAKGKSIGFSECGTGSKGNPTDPTVALLDDVEWVKWFWRTCQSAISQGVPIAHMNIWNIYASDGQWLYNAPDTYDPQPNVALAYRKYFLDDHSSGETAPTGSTGATAPTGATGSTGQIASAVITDINNVSATLSISGLTHTFYTNETGLADNIFVYDDGAGGWVIAPNNASRTPKCVLTKNGLSIVAIGFTTIIDGSTGTRLHPSNSR